MDYNPGVMDKIKARIAALRTKPADYPPAAPVRPVPAMLGTGAAANAAQDLRDRGRKMADAMEEQTR